MNPFECPICTSPALKAEFDSDCPLCGSASIKPELNALAVQWIEEFRDAVENNRVFGTPLPKIN
jgi:hypothetical protein